MRRFMAIHISGDDDDDDVPVSWTRDQPKSKARETNDVRAFDVQREGEDDVVGVQLITNISNDWDGMNEVMVE